MLEDHTERQTTDNSKTMCIDIRLTEEEPKMLKQRYPWNYLWAGCRYLATLLKLLSKIICRICSYVANLKNLLFDKNCHILILTKKEVFFHICKLFYTTKKMWNNIIIKLSITRFTIEFHLSIYIQFWCKRFKPIWVIFSINFIDITLCPLAFLTTV